MIDVKDGDAYICHGVYYLFQHENKKNMDSYWHQGVDGFCVVQIFYTFHGTNLY